MVKIPIPIKEINEAAQPLVELLHKYYHIHCTAIVTEYGITIVEDLTHIPLSPKKLDYGT